MSPRKLLFSVWIALVAACFASVVFGNGGLIALGRLERERARLQANMGELGKLNGELEGALESLRTDPDAIAVYARELGYAPSERDRFIRIAGLPSATRRAVPAGNLLKAERPEGLSDGDIRVFAALAGVGAFAAMLYLGRGKRRRGVSGERGSMRRSASRP